MVDGTQTAIITASANGFPAASKSIAVLNDDADHFEIATIPSPQFAGAPFTIVVTAFDASGKPMLDFAKPLTVTASVGGGASLAVTPNAISDFHNGVFTGPVAISPAANGVVLTVRDDAGRSAVSNPINLIAGTPDFFTELFMTDNDVDNQSFLSSRTGTLSGYVIRRQPTTTFFTDPTGGTPLSLGDDTFAEVTAGERQIAVPLWCALFVDVRRQQRLRHVWQRRRRIQRVARGPLRVSADRGADG